MKLKRLFGVALAIPLALIAMLIVMLFNGCHQIYDPVHKPNNIPDAEKKPESPQK